LGKTLAFFGLRGTIGGISLVSLSGDRTSRVFVQAPNSVQVHAAFSPDGRWVAYASTEAPPIQVFVQPYPTTGAKYQVTAESSGAAFPVWSPDGKQIFYGFPPKLFVVDVRTQPTFSLGKPITLPINGTVQPAPGMRNFDVAPDGKHLLV